MSLLIKGMEMPSDGTYTMNVHIVDGKAIVRKLDKNGLGAYEMIEIPTPHGRLIDADAVTKELSYVSNRPVKSQLWIIGQAPTVIESEE